MTRTRHTKGSTSSKSTPCSLFLRFSEYQLAEPFGFW